MSDLLLVNAERLSKRLHDLAKQMETCEVAGEKINLLDAVDRISIYADSPNGSFEVSVDRARDAEQFASVKAIARAYLVERRTASLVSLKELVLQFEAMTSELQS